MKEGHNHDHDLNTNTHNLLSRFSADIASALNLMKKGINHDHTIHTAKRDTNKPRILIVDDNPRF